MRRKVDGRSVAFARKPAVPYDSVTPAGRGTDVVNSATFAQFACTVGVIKSRATTSTTTCENKMN
jgi:hypothetical protein